MRGGVGRQDNLLRGGVGVEVPNPDKSPPPIGVALTTHPDLRVVNTELVDYPHQANLDAFFNVGIVHIVFIITCEYLTLTSLSK